jgi:hypothetical protein
MDEKEMWVDLLISDKGLGRKKISIFSGIINGILI